MRLGITIILPVSLLLFCLIACGKEIGDEYVDNSPIITFPDSLHVFLIGFDGWSGHSISNVDMPNLQLLMDNGRYSFFKRSVMPSSSGPNWASMFMGVDVSQHGYTNWNSFKPDYPSEFIGPNGICPTICTVLREQKPESIISVFYEWEGIRYYVDTIAVNICKQYPLYAYASDSRQMTAEACSYIKDQNPTFLSIIYSEPDYTGHRQGFGSQEYFSKCNALDDYLGLIIQSIKDAGILDQSIIIVTSDHGGIGKDHGGDTPEERDTPFIISGAFVQHTGEFTQPMYQYDVAAVIAYIFNLKTPQSWIGKRCGWLFDY